ncbi:hypothetical protein EH223_03800 [candidate division KSB1 bacterium]|nr:hypothetical protein [candidate division KSB1 bacterium]RQW05721.1 MAG: hypothetical protein EH223_03800 [candidate division KSB1 bacterium]
MEIFGLVSSILLALILVAITHSLYKKRDKIPYYRPIRDKFKRKKKKPEKEPTQRMLVVIRRHPIGRAALMTLEESQYEEQKARTLALMEQLVREWSEVAQHKWGFHGSEYGLPSSNDENWMLFAAFVVKDHDTYRKCLERMQSETYLPLRRQCDIRVLYGEEMERLPSHTVELFRQGFSR